MIQSIAAVVAGVVHVRLGVVNIMKKVKIKVLTENVKIPDAHQGEEGRMHRTHLAQMISDATMLLDMFDDTTDLPEWLEVKITKASDYISSATRYLAGEKSRDQGRLSGGEVSDEWKEND